MEILFWIQPMFVALMSVSGALMIFYLIVTLVHYDSACNTKNLESKLKYKSSAKRYTKIGYIFVFVFILSTPLSCSDKTYKNILLYRGITSDNAQEIMDSSTRILKLAEKYVESKVKK